MWATQSKTAGHKVYFALAKPKAEKWGENIKICFIFLASELFGTLNVMAQDC